TMFTKTIYVLLLALGLSTGAMAQGGNPCLPDLVDQIQAELIDQGYDCLEGAGPFACIDDVFIFAETNCPLPIDTTWGNPCDPDVVAQVTSDMILFGFDCLVGAGPFTCADEVYNYAYANCPPPIDTSWGDPCSPASVEQMTNDFIAQGFDCLINAGPFACIDDVINYAFENCPPPIDTSWGNPCDSAEVALFIDEMIFRGFDCLVDAPGPFPCIEDVVNYALVNCAPVDTTWGNPCDSANVQFMIDDLIAEGFDCLVGAGPFACVEDVFNYAFENCEPTYGDDCDSASVQQTINDLVAEGFDCLVGAGPFECVHEVVCYAFENCAPPMDTTWQDVPECLRDIPVDVVTFQQFLQYAIDNCGPEVTDGIPACWLTAPMFDTDDEFLQWIMANCEGDSLIYGPSGKVATSFFGQQQSSGTANPNTLEGVRLSPNPTANDVTIRLDKGTIQRVELMDMNGSLIKLQDNVAASQTELSLGAQPAGIYMARVTDTEGRVAVERVVKQ
ncbi:MAG: T9SS type A sorting domain-containing protein, partial [Saprospiraceae bacterium]|nr:T9SS type A sorting domain-containing protein [Saprospiraceae bacterium]